MPNLARYDQLALDLLKGVHQFHSHGYKVAFSNRAPVVATDAVFADIVEIGSGNGYAAGGAVADVISVSKAANVGKVVFSLDDTITASGGSIGPYRYIVLYNTTNNALVGYWDKGASVTLLDTDSQLADYDQVAGVLALTV